MLSVARSTRASNDAELINTKALDRFPIYAQVLGQVDRAAGQVRLQLDLSATASSPEFTGVLRTKSRIAGLPGRRRLSR